jgi:hypothetical protein
MSGKLAYGGVVEANKILEEGLTILKTATRPNIIERTTEEMNCALYGAIEQFPTEVNAVVIPVSIDIATIEEGLPEDFDYKVARYQLKDFLKYYPGARKVDDRVEVEFVKHLPYEFTTHRHGSGERNAFAASCSNIAFETGIYPEIVPDYLQLDLAEGGIFERYYVYVFPDEIKSISLMNVSDDNFTNNSRKSGLRLTFRKSPSSATHYLGYSGFTPHYISAERIPPMEFREEIANKVMSITIPETSARSIRLEWDGWGDKDYISGFAVDQSGSGPVLYEFEWQEVPQLPNDPRSEMGVALVAYAIAKHQQSPQENIQTYWGDEILDRLSQIKTERKF